MGHSGPAGRPALPGRAAAALAAALFGGAGPAQAGAWTREPGETLAIAKLRETFVSGRFDAAGIEVEDDPYRKHEADLWVEHGVLPWLTGLGELVVQEVDEGGATGRDPRIEASFGARVRFVSSEDLVLSVEGRIFVPNHSLSREQGFLETGHVEGEARLLAGTGTTLFGRHAYVDLQAAWRPRDGGVSDLFQASAMTGIEIWGPLTATFGGKTLLEVEDGFGGAVSERHEAAAGLLLKADDDWVLEAGVVATLAGRETPADVAASFAVWRRF